LLVTVVQFTLFLWTNFTFIVIRPFCIGKAFALAFEGLLPLPSKGLCLRMAFVFAFEEPFCLRTAFAFPIEGPWASKRPCLCLKARLPSLKSQCSTYIESNYSLHHFNRCNILRHKLSGNAISSDPAVKTREIVSKEDRCSLVTVVQFTFCLRNVFAFEGPLPTKGLFAFKVPLHLPSK
jgi:hypothetical protein